MHSFYPIDVPFLKTVSNQAGNWSNGSPETGSLSNDAQRWEMRSGFRLRWNIYARAGWAHFVLRCRDPKTACAYSDVDLRNDTRNLLSLHTDVGANLSDFETASFFATLFKSDWVNLRFSSHVM